MANGTGIHSNGFLVMHNPFIAAKTIFTRPRDLPEAAHANMFLDREVYQQFQTAEEIIAACPLRNYKTKHCLTSAAETVGRRPHHQEYMRN